MLPEEGRVSPVGDLRLLLYMFETFCNKKLKETAERGAWAMVSILSLPAFKVEQASWPLGLRFPYQQHQLTEIKGFQLPGSGGPSSFDLEAVFK